MALTTTSLLLASQAAGTLATVSSTVAQSRAERAQGDYQSRISRLNAELATLSASDAIRRGERLTAQRFRQARQIIGAQRAAFAAQGVIVGVGTALELELQEAEAAAGDAITLRNNAYREAFGFRVEAISLEEEARLARTLGRERSRATLLTGGIMAARDVLGSLYRVQDDPILLESQRDQFRPVPERLQIESALRIAGFTS